MKFTVLSIISLLIIFSCTYSLETIPLKLNEEYVGVLHRDPDKDEAVFPLYFNISLEGVEKQDEEYITLIAIPNDFKSDPDVYYSLTDDIPDLIDLSLSTNTNKCTLYGEDICFLSQEMYDRKFIIAAANSYKECHFKLIAQITRTKIVTEKLYKFTIEKTYYPHLLKYTIDNKDIQHLKFLIKYKLDKDDTFITKPLVQVSSKGNLPSTNWNQFPVFETDYGYLFSAQKDDSFLFCTNCDYHILIYGQKHQQVTVKKSIDIYEENIVLEEKYINALYNQDQFTYILDSFDINRKNEKIDENLLIVLETLQGIPLLYINCDSIPDSLDEYHWKSKSYYDQSILITKQEFQEFDARCSAIFITVAVRAFAAYKLEVKKFSHNKMIVIKTGINEKGYMQKGDIINYKLRLPQTHGTFKVVIGVKHHKGASDIAIKQVNEQEMNNTQMRFTKTEFQNAGQKTSNIFLFSKHKSQQEYLYFHHNPEFCQASADSKTCTYIIGLYGNQTAQSKSKEISYEILVHLEEFSIELFTNQIEQFQQAANTFKYFSFNLYDSTNIKSVNFVLTLMYGEANMYGSRQTKYPSYDDFDNVAFLDDNLLTYNKINYDFDLKGNYFFSIEALSKIQYSIVVIIEKEQEEENVYILQNNIFQKIQFFENQNYIKFSFSIDFLNEDVNLIVDLLRGTAFKGYLYNGLLNSTDKIESFDDTIIFDTSYLHIPKSNITANHFCGMIVIKKVRNPTINIKFYQNHIPLTFHEKEKLKFTLSPNQQVTTNIEVSKNQLININFDRNNSKVKLNLASNPGSEYILFTEDDFVEQKRDDDNTDVFTISSNVLPHCMDNFQQNETCKLYIVLKSEALQVENVVISYTKLEDTNVTGQEEENFFEKHILIVRLFLIFLILIILLSLIILYVCVQKLRHTKKLLEHQKLEEETNLNQNLDNQIDGNGEENQDDQIQNVNASPHREQNKDPEQVTQDENQHNNDEKAANEKVEINVVS